MSLIRTIPFGMNTMTIQSPTINAPSKAAWMCSFTTSAPLEKDLEVRVKWHAELYVSSSRKTRIFSITLCDVQPDGKSINLSASMRAISGCVYRNGFTKQELMSPGRFTKSGSGSCTHPIFSKGDIESVCR